MLTTTPSGVSLRNADKRQSSTISFPHSTTSIAGSAVYAIPELRCRILALLDRRTLVTFMRVDKQGLRGVAEILYHTVRYPDTQNHMYSSHILMFRLVVKCTANLLKIIDCQGMAMKWDMNMSGMFAPMPNFGFEEYDWEMGWEEWLKAYQPELIEVLIPYLRKQYPSLRQVKFGSEASDWNFWIVPNSWTVTLTSAADPADTPTIGWIDHVQTLHFEAGKEPPVDFNKLMPDNAPSGYIMRNRFNLHVEIEDEENEVAWLRTLDKDPMIVHLHTTLILEGLTIDLASLTALYDKQSQAGSPVRLRKILSSATLPFSIPDFLSFARVASTSLSLLCLLHSDEDNDDILTFDDIPQLAAIIHRCLPNLTHLTIEVKGIEKAEIVCKDMLDLMSLEGGGSLELLKIFTNHKPDPLFNTSRVLSSLLVRESSFELHIGPGQGGPMSDTDQTRFIKYLRAQPYSRRAPLATVDFPSLGLSDLSEVADLIYDSEDKPYHSDYTQALKWRDIAKTANTLANDQLIPSLDNLFHTSSHHVATIEVPGTDDELASLRKQLEAAKEVEAIQQRIVDSLDGVHTMRLQIERAIRRKEMPNSLDLEEIYLREQEMENGDYYDFDEEEYGDEGDGDDGDYW